MIWLKRILPLLIIIIVWLGYGYYSDYKAVKKAESDQKYSEVTALVWMASAKYRKDPEKFIRYRDSLLAAVSLDIKKAHQFIDSYKKAPEELGVYAALVGMYIDSLAVIEDSIIKANKDTLSDTTSTGQKIIKLE